MAPMQSPFKPLSQMSLRDFEALGFKGGLEVHQQLLTRGKLFCRCPAGVYTSRTDAVILRHMRPTLSEMGEYDPTALMEFKTRKEIVYLLNRDTVCTYEMDDAPPFEMDQEALAIAMEIALLLDLNLVDELHVARKQYLDGSIPTGFQRTTILGVEGRIVVDGKRVGIKQLGLEEDACRIVSDIGHTVTFRTDRLGMPLVEVVTHPELYTPFEIARAGEVIRELTRATGKVRTGHGSARQDVNVSIEGGTRIEIKGVASLKAIPKLTYFEAMRQWNLLRIRNLLHQRGITADEFEASWREVTQIVSKADYTPIRHAIERGHAVAAVRLAGFAGILSEELLPGLNFAYELSERVRVIACLMEMPNLVHSDSMNREISNNMWDRLRRALRATKEDALVLVWGPREDVKTAAEEIIIRAKEATEGVPKETRQPRPDGTTGFERLLPGPNRMYPDTDLPPMPISEEFVQQIRVRLPKPPWERRNELAELGLPEDVIGVLMVRPHLAKLLDETCSLLPQEGHRLAALLIVQRLEGLRRRGVNMAPFTPKALAQIVKAVLNGKVRSESLFYLLWDIALQPGLSVENAIERYHKPENEQEFLRKVCDELRANPPQFLSSNPDSRRRWLCGLILKRSRGRVSHSAARAKADELLPEVENAGL